MSTSPMEYATAAQERTLTALKQSQSLAVEAVENWAKALENAAPDRPAIPVLASMPNPEELIKNSFDFAEKVLATQRQFAQELLSATATAIKTTPVETPGVK